MISPSHLEYYFLTITLKASIYMVSTYLSILISRLSLLLSLCFIFLSGLQNHQGLLHSGSFRYSFFCLECSVPSFSLAGPFSTLKFHLDYPSWAPMKTSLKQIPCPTTPPSCPLSQAHLPLYSFPLYHLLKIIIISLMYLFFVPIL